MGGVGEGVGCGCRMVMGGTEERGWSGEEGWSGGRGVEWGEVKGRGWDGGVRDGDGCVGRQCSGRRTCKRVL